MSTDLSAPHYVISLKLLTALKCAVCSMMYQSSVMEVVSTLKIYKTVTLVKISPGSQLVTSANVHGAGIIVHMYFKVGR